MRAKLIAGLSGLVLITVLIATPAGAAKPVVNEGEFENTDVNDECGFDITVHDTFRFRETLRFDGDELVRAQLHIQGTTSITSEWGEAFDRWAWNGTFDPDTGLATERGNVFNIHAGAGGILVNESGRKIIDTSTGEFVFKSGPEFQESDLANICVALAPPGA